MKTQNLTLFQMKSEESDRHAGCIKSLLNWLFRCKPALTSRRGDRHAAHMHTWSVPIKTEVDKDFCLARVQREQGILCFKATTRNVNVARQAVTSRITRRALPLTTTSTHKTGVPLAGQVSRRRPGAEPKGHSCCTRLVFLEDKDINLLDRRSYKWIVPNWMF